MLRHKTSHFAPLHHLFFSSSLPSTVKKYMHIKVFTGPFRLKTRARCFLNYSHIVAVIEFEKR